MAAESLISDSFYASSAGHTNTPSLHGQQNTELTSSILYQSLSSTKNKRNRLDDQALLLQRLESKRNSYDAGKIKPAPATSACRLHHPPLIPRPTPVDVSA